MNISLSGAANCGKTTLVQKLSTALSLPVIDERFDLIMRGIQGENSIKSIQLLFQQVFEMKKTAELECVDGYITDRCPLDLFNFFSSLNVLLQSSDVNHFYEACRSHVQQYDYVIIPPWGVASYQDLDSYVIGESKPIMNPWINMNRHASTIGLALMWLPVEKVLIIPDDILSTNEQCEWIIERICNPTKNKQN